MALLSCAMHLDFKISYLDPKARTKAHLDVDGCQIIIVEKELCERDTTALKSFNFY